MHRTEVDFLYDLLENVARTYSRRGVVGDASAPSTDERSEEAVLTMADALADASRSESDGTDAVRSE